MIPKNAMQTTLELESQLTPQTPPPPRRGRWRFWAIVLCVHVVLIGAVVLIQGCSKNESASKSEDTSLPPLPETTGAAKSSPEDQGSLAAMPNREALTPEERPSGPDNGAVVPAPQAPMPPAPVEPPPPAPVPAKVEPAPVESTTHVVVKGDTLSRIAKHYGTSIHDLAALNQISADTVLKIGQKLKVPAAKAGASKARPSLKVTAPTTLRSGKIHEVKAGETLTSIARHYGVSVETLKKANNLGDDTKLRVNQKLQIPSAASKSAKPSASRGSSRARPVVVEERRVNAGREIRGV